MDCESQLKKKQAKALFSQYDCLVFVYHFNEACVSYS